MTAVPEVGPVSSWVTEAALGPDPANDQLMTA